MEWPASSPRLLALVCCLSALVFAALAVAVAVARSRTRGWDSAVTRRLRPLVGLAPHPLDADVFLNAVLVLCAIALAVAIVVLVQRRQLLLAASVVAAVGGTIVLDPLLKMLFRRPAINPADHGYSFPSGSAMITAAAVTALILLARGSRWRVATAVIGIPGVVICGIAIVDARWHYPSDVAGGWALATAWVTAIWLLARRYANPAISRGQRGT